MESCYPLTCLLTVTYTSVADCLHPEMTKHLQNEIFHYRSHTYLQNIKATYRTHRNSYLRFCQLMEYPHASSSSTYLPVCRVLSYNPQSHFIPNYFNIISILHKEFNLPNPLANNWALQSLLTGIKHVKGQSPA